MNIKEAFSHLILIIIVLLLMISISSCAFKCVSRHKNIVYLNATSSKPAQQLNVFAPRKHTTPKDVFIFIHGGNWNSGKKSLYNFFGNRLARKDVVAVIIDYPLSPAAAYNEMATDAAIAVKWVKDNISRYGGNPDRIFLSGHSAGGHLAALICINDAYFDSLYVKNPVKGAILIDAAGFDMHLYLKDEGANVNPSYLTTFSSSPAIWKKASPINYLHKGMPPMIIFRGEKTYPSIIKNNERFINELKTFVPAPDFSIVKGKKHVPMITQFFNPYNKRYKEIIHFMQTTR